MFAGTSSEDASDWLDLFERISKINNWSGELQLEAFPIYLTGIARAWYLTLADDQKTNWDNLKQVFQDRFTSGPQNWLLSQQLSARKQLSTEPLDKYITDITRLCKRLKLSDEQSTRYFIDGLQRDLKDYVSLAQPTSFQQAETLARMKHTVNQQHGPSDSNSLVDKLHTLLSNITDKLEDKSKVVAAASTSSSTPDKRFESLSRQIKQLQKQLQPQPPTSTTDIAVFDQSQGQSRYVPQRGWQGPQNRQFEQLQRQVVRLENELRRYKNPRHPDFRSFGRSFRSIEGDPICTFCQRIGHTWRSCRQRNRDPRLPPPNTNSPRALPGPSSAQSSRSQLNE